MASIIPLLTEFEKEQLSERQPLPEKYLGLSDEEMDARIAAARRALGGRLLILGHHYQRDEVIKFADATGDSFRLARQIASHPDADYIVFCGVHFMAESADVLAAPRQQVILPDLAAGCSMADMVAPDQLESCWEELTQMGVTKAPAKAGHDDDRSFGDDRGARADRSVRLQADRQQSSGMPAFHALTDDVAGGALDAKGHFAPIGQRQRQGVHTRQHRGFADAADVDVAVNGWCRPGLAAVRREVVIDPEGEPVPCGAKGEVLRAYGTNAGNGVEKTFGHDHLSRPQIVGGRRILCNLK